MVPTPSRPHMPGYGLATGAGHRPLPWSWAVERLTRSTNYWVSSVAADGQPHVMPVWALWWEGAVVFSTGGRSVKAANLRRDPRCTVTTEDAAEPVVVRGQAHEVDAGALGDVLPAYAAKYGEEPPEPTANPVFAVRPTWAFGVMPGEAFATSATRWTFDDPGR